MNLLDSDVSRLVSRVSTVDDTWSDVENQVNNQWSKIFCQKYLRWIGGKKISPKRDCNSCMLDIQYNIINICSYPRWPLPTTSFAVGQVDACTCRCTSKPLFLYLRASSNSGYSWILTVDHPTWGPRSLKYNLLPLRRPSEFRVCSSFRLLPSGMQDKTSMTRRDNIL